MRAMLSNRLASFRLVITAWAFVLLIRFGFRLRLALRLCIGQSSLLRIIFCLLKLQLLLFFGFVQAGLHLIGRDFVSWLHRGIVSTSDDVSEIWLVLGVIFLHGQFNLFGHYHSCILDVCWDYSPHLQRLFLYLQSLYSYRLIWLV